MDQGHVWLVYRDAPASEIVGAYTDLLGAAKVARTMDPEMVMLTEVTPTHYSSGLWHFTRIKVEKIIW